MHPRRFRIWPALLVLSVLFALLTVAPAAVGASNLSVSFGATAGGQRTLVLSGNGFAPGERVTITGLANDGSIVNYPDATANPVGAFDMSVSYNPSVLSLKAVGQLTGITAYTDVGGSAGRLPGFVQAYPRINPCDVFDTLTYYYGCPGAYAVFFPGYTVVPGTVPVTAPPPTTNSTAATVGTAVTFSATGFSPNETVAAWVTGPDSSVTQIGSAPASGDGTVTITVTFPSAGNWQVTTHGQASQKEVVNRFTVT